MTQEELQAEIKQEWELYESVIDTIARSTFHNAIKPFLRARRWSFAAGMGTWCIYQPTVRNGSEAIDHERLISEGNLELQDIVAILETEVPGFECNELGSLMPDYNPDNE